MERRCIHCAHWTMDGTVEVRNRLTEERASQAQFGDGVGLAGACEHPDSQPMGRLSTRTCELWEAHPELDKGPSSDTDLAGARPAA